MHCSLNNDSQRSKNIEKIAKPHRHTVAYSSQGYILLNGVVEWLAQVIIITCSGELTGTCSTQGKPKLAIIHPSDILVKHGLAQELVP